MRKLATVRPNLRIILDKLTIEPKEVKTRQGCGPVPASSISLNRDFDLGIVEANGTSMSRRPGSLHASVTWNDARKSGAHSVDRPDRRARYDSNVSEPLEHDVAEVQCPPLPSASAKYHLRMSVSRNRCGNHKRCCSPD